MCNADGTITIDIDTKHLRLLAEVSRTNQVTVREVVNRDPRPDWEREPVLSRCNCDPAPAPQ